MWNRESEKNLVNWMFNRNILNKYNTKDNKFSEIRASWTKFERIENWVNKREDEEIRRTKWVNFRVWDFWKLPYLILHKRKIKIKIQNYSILNLTLKKKQNSTKIIFHKIKIVHVIKFIYYLFHMFKLILKFFIYYKFFSSFFLLF